MDDSTFLFLYTVALVAAVIFYLYLRIKNQILDQKIKELVEQARQRVIGLEVEFDQGQYFCYNQSDQSFVCQGANAQEVRERFTQRFPNRNAFVVGGDPEAVKRLKIELNDLQESANPEAT